MPYHNHSLLPLLRLSRTSGHSPRVFGVAPCALFLVLVLAGLAGPATAHAQNTEDVARDHLAGLYYQSEKEGYAELLQHARVLAAAILNNKEWHVVHHQLHMPDKGNPHRVATRYTLVEKQVLELVVDDPEFVLEFRVIQHDSRDIQRRKARGLSPLMDPTDKVFRIRLDDKTPEKFRGSQLSRLKPESVSEWRDGARLPDEMISGFRGWPSPAALEEERAEQAVEAFKKMVGVWEELLATHEKLREMEARSFLEEMAANQKLRMKYKNR